MVAIFLHRVEAPLPPPAPPPDHRRRPASSLLPPPPPHHCPAQVTSFSKEGFGLWGFTVSFLKDGVSAADVRVAFDEESTYKHEWVGRGAGLLPSEDLTPARRRGRRLPHPCCSCRRCCCRRCCCV